MAEKNATVKGTTTSGFAFEVDVETLEDAEFLELFEKVQEGNNLKSFALAECMLGKKQKSALYDHVRNKKGRVPVTALSTEIAEIIVALSEAKETKN